MYYLFFRAALILPESRASNFTVEACCAAEATSRGSARCLPLTRRRFLDRGEFISPLCVHSAHIPKVTVDIRTALVRCPPWDALHGVGDISRLLLVTSALVA